MVLHSPAARAAVAAQVSDEITVGYFGVLGTQFNTLNNYDTNLTKKFIKKC